jgi:hypothetical protein
MEDTVRRRSGFMLGFILGLAYGAVANLINRIYLPGIPLYVPPPGTFGLILLTAFMFGLLGLLSAWTEESVPGILLSALAGSVLSSAWIIFNESNRATALIALLIVFLPRVFFYLPLSLAVRGILSQFEPSPYHVTPPVRKVAPVVISILVAMLMGVFSLKNWETRQSLTKMNELVQAGMQAKNRDELPRSLQPVRGFTTYARGEYVFDIGPDPDVLPVQRPIVEFGAIEPFIIVIFENGFRFGCVFSPPYEVPACIDF